MEKGPEQAQAGSRRTSGGREPVAGWVTGPGDARGKDECSWASTSLGLSLLIVTEGVCTSMGQHELATGYFLSPG